MTDSTIALLKYLHKIGADLDGNSLREGVQLLQTRGLTAIDKSKVSRICKELDGVVEGFRDRPLEGEYPYLRLDALYLKVRQIHRIVSQAMVIAIGVRETGERDILEFAVGPSEEDAFWLDFLNSLVRRGPNGRPAGHQRRSQRPQGALAQALGGVTWQRCRVHFMRNILDHVPKGDKAIVAAAQRTILSQPDRQAAGQQLAEVMGAMRARWPKAAELLAEAEDVVLAYMSFLPEHWSRTYSTNPPKRLSKEIKRRTYVVGVLPDQPSVIRLVGSVLVELADEWHVTRRYFSQELVRNLADPKPLFVSEPAPFRLAPVH